MQAHGRYAYSLGLDMAAMTLAVTNFLPSSPWPLQQPSFGCYHERHRRIRPNEWMLCLTKPRISFMRSFPIRTKSTDARKCGSFVMLDGIVCSVISFPKMNEIACHCRRHSFVQLVGPLEMTSTIEKNSFDQIIQLLVNA